jgi:hypothetical protein
MKTNQEGKEVKKMDGMNTDHPRRWEVWKTLQTMESTESYNNLSMYCQEVGNLVSTQYRVHIAVGAEPKREEEICVERQ